MPAVWFRSGDYELLLREVERLARVEGVEVAPGEAVRLLILEAREHRRYRERMGRGPRPL